MFQRSIQTSPTAEAHTYLGRAYRLQGKLDEAIEECKTAIDIDPEFGNSYNDLGAYLVDQAEFSAAIPPLERALECERYATPHFAWFNMGRAYLALGDLTLARACQREARRLAPKGWITGLGFTWGTFMTQTAQSVIDGTFKPGFVRLGGRCTARAARPARWRSGRRSTVH